MYTKQPKKLLIINILDILRKHSDENHRLTQKQIMEILMSEYGMEADRKAIKRNLMNLIDFGYNLEFKEITRINKSGEEETVYTDWYLNREFSDSELRLLIDSLLFSKYIPYSQCKNLIEKIEGLSSRHFKSRVKHVRSLPNDQPHNAELFYTIEILDEAIEKRRKVSFHYGDFGTDKKLKLRHGSDGEIRKYIANPYQMVAANSRYYLICNLDKYDNVGHYRLDRIRDIKIIDEPTKPQRKVKGLENGLDLPKHMAEHVYMFSGESADITMVTRPEMVGDIIDWFGRDAVFTNETENSVTVHVRANLAAMRYWALQYSRDVTILSPQSLVDDVKKDLREAISKYEGEN